MYVIFTKKTDFINHCRKCPYLGLATGRLAATPWVAFWCVCRMFLSVANLILHEHLEGEFATHVAFPNAKLEKKKLCFERATMNFWPNSSTKTPTTVVERLGHCSIKEPNCSHNSGNRTRFFLIKKCQVRTTSDQIICFRRRIILHALEILAPRNWE